MQSNIEKYAYLTLVVIVGLLILRLKTALPGSVDHFFPLSISHDLLVTGGKFSDWVLMSAPSHFGSRVSARWHTVPEQTSECQFWHHLSGFSGGCL